MFPLLFLSVFQRVASSPDSAISQCSRWIPKGFIKGSPSVPIGDVWCQVGIAEAEGNAWFACADGTTKPTGSALLQTGICPPAVAESRSLRGNPERELYSGGLPSYNDPVWDILAPWAVTPFLIKHAVAAFKGDDKQRQLQASTSDEARHLLDVPVYQRFVQSVGDSYTCMFEHFGDFLAGHCPGHKRRVSEQQDTSESIHI